MEDIASEPGKSTPFRGTQRLHATDASPTSPVLDLPEQDGLSLGWEVVAWSVEVAVRWVGSCGGSGGVATPERRRRRQGR